MRRFSFFEVPKDFELDIPDEDAEKIQSVQDALDYITNNQ